MKLSYIILSIFFVLIGCSSDDAEYANISGTVQRVVNGEGIADQSVIVITRKRLGSGMFSSFKELDRKEVITDANGNFSVSLISEVDAFVTIVHEGDDNYSGAGYYLDYPINKPIIIESDKFIKFKIFVNNSNPFDDNDFINIEFFAGSLTVKRTGIENFGVANIYHPEEPLPGGGSIGPWEETSWIGTDVNSIVYYSVSERAEHFKIRWNMKKNGVETDGFTDDIPYEIDQVNPFSYNY